MKTQLVYSNNYDHLTGLNNRQYFIQCLNKVIDEKHQESITITGVVFHIDLDKFQVINNNFGYAFGDKFFKFYITFSFRFFYQNLILPALFIPAAEKYSLIIKLDRWVIDRTFLAISELEHKLTDDKQS